MNTKAAPICAGLCLMLGLPGLVAAQSDTEARADALRQIEVYGPSLEGNLEGDDPTRDVFVYLPPSYADDADRRYPVVYFLHGYTATAEAYVRMLDLAQSADAAIAAGAREMIVVLPDAFTKYGGSMYSNSPTIGDWETYVATDLVAYIDSHYRTIPERLSRGLSGHSMGGYGTMRIGMKSPEVFGALYAMSSCCLMNEAPPREAVETQEAGRGKAPAPEGGFANAMSAQAAAWAPNPTRPPYFYDWPYENGEALPLVAAKWIANSPLILVDQYVPHLLQYEAIALDVGDADPLLDNNVDLDAALSRLGIEHSFELYEGDHVNRVRTRFREKVLPLFSETLEFH